jgi:hypothetical protein
MPPAHIAATAIDRSYKLTPSQNRTNGNITIGVHNNNVKHHTIQVDHSDPNRPFILNGNGGNRMFSIIGKNTYSKHGKRLSRNVNRV